MQNEYDEIDYNEILSGFKKVTTLISLLNNKTYSSTTFILEVIKNKNIMLLLEKYLEITKYSFIEFYSYQYPTASKSKKYNNEKTGNIRNVDDEQPKKRTRRRKSEIRSA